MHSVDDHSVRKVKKIHIRPRFITLILIGIITAALMIVGARWYGENQAKKNADKEIQALREQVASLQKKIITSDKVSKENKDKGNELNYLTISEFGIKVPLTKDTDDLVYAVVNKDSVALSLKRLVVDEPGCDIMTHPDGGSVGMIVKASPDEIEPLSGEVITSAHPEGAIVNGAYYYYLPSQATCSDKMISVEEAAHKALISAAKQIVAL